MGMLAPALAVEPRSAFDDYWYQPASAVGSVVGPVDPNAAMTLPAFYAAVTYVSEDTGKTSLSMFEDQGEIGNRPAAEHELQTLLHNQPNRHQDAIEWREMVTAWAMLRGKGVNEEIYGSPTSYPGVPTRPGRLAQIVPLHPDLVREETSSADGTRVYIYRDPMKKGQERKLLEDEVFVVRGRQSRSVLDFASVNLGTEIAKERYAAFMFTRGAKHQGVVESPKRLPDPVKEALRFALDEYAIGGPRAGRPLLLEDGLTWKQVSMSMKDAELLAAQQFTVSQVCRWIRVPPHKVFDLTRSTNNNIETQGVDYVTDCLLAWAIRWEQAIWRDLITDKRFFAKHNLDIFLRGDTEARFKAYALAVMWGWMTRNEIRAKEDLNRIEGLDKPLTPENMTTNPNGDTTVNYPVDQPRAGFLQLTAGDVGRLKLIASDAASRVVRREVAAMTKLADRVGVAGAAWQAGVEAHYSDFATHVVETLHVPDHIARQYVAEQQAALIEGGPAVMDDWLIDRAAHLARLAAEDKLEMEAAA